jgi:hypothetical protein
MKLLSIVALLFSFQLLAAEKYWPTREQFIRFQKADLKETEKMLKDGFDPNVTYNTNGPIKGQGETLLVGAMVAGFQRPMDDPRRGDSYNRYEYMKLLLKYGADPNKMVIEGSYRQGTAMHWAAKMCSVLLFDLLIQYGGKPNERYWYYTFEPTPKVSGITTFSTAAREGCYPVAIYMMDKLKLKPWEPNCGAYYVVSIDFDEPNRPGRSNHTKVAKEINKRFPKLHETDWETLCPEDDAED